MGPKSAISDLGKPLLVLANFQIRVFTGFGKPLCLLAFMKNEGPQ